MTDQSKSSIPESRVKKNVLYIPVLKIVVLKRAQGILFFLEISYLLG